MAAGATQIVHSSTALTRISDGVQAIEQSGPVQSTEDIVKQVISSLPPVPSRADLVNAVTQEVVQRMLTGMAPNPTSAAPAQPPVPLTAAPQGGSPRTP